MKESFLTIIRDPLTLLWIAICFYHHLPEAKSLARIPCVVKQVHLTEEWPPMTPQPMTTYVLYHVTSIEKRYRNTHQLNMKCNHLYRAFAEQRPKSSDRGTSQRNLFNALFLAKYSFLTGQLIHRLQSFISLLILEK